MKLSPQDVESLKDGSAAEGGWNGFSYVNNEVGGGAAMEMDI
jgi:hypothetical protein